MLQSEHLFHLMSAGTGDIYSASSKFVSAKNLIDPADAVYTSLPIHNTFTLSIILVTASLHSIMGFVFSEAIATYTLLWSQCLK